MRDTSSSYESNIGLAKIPSSSCNLCFDNTTRPKTQRHAKFFRRENNEKVEPKTTDLKEKEDDSESIASSEHDVDITASLAKIGENNGIESEPQSPTLVSLNLRIFVDVIVRLCLEYSLGSRMENTVGPLGSHNDVTICSLSFGQSCVGGFPIYIRSRNR